jgi:hypothetical protein
MADVSCDPALPKRFILREDWVSPRSSYSILRAPDELRRTNTNTAFIKAMKNIQNQQKIGSFKLKLLTLRGWVGFPRVRVWNTRSTPARMVAHANAKGSLKLDEIMDWKYKFTCGGQKWTLKEEKQRLVRDLITSVGRTDDATMVMNVYRGHDVQDSSTLVTKAFIEKTVAARGTYTTRIHFDDKRGAPIPGLFAKRVTDVAGDWKSGLRSKWYVETDHRSLIPPRVVALVAVTYSWKSGASTSMIGTAASAIGTGTAIYDLTRLVV